MRSTVTQRIRYKKYLSGCLGNNGFTLVETLFALGLFSLLSVFMTGALANITDWHVEDANTTARMEWNIFIRQLEGELQKTGDFSVPKNNVLLLNDKGNEITYETYSNMVRRRVNGTGHEMILQNVKSFRLIKEAESLTISVILINGDKYEKRLYKRYKYEPS